MTRGVLRPPPVPRAEMAANAARWREAFIETVRPAVGAPVMLSGGMDSATVVAALLAVGDRPRCLTYRVAGRPSEDADSAVRIAEAYGLRLETVILGSDEAAVEASAREAIGLLNVTRKVAVQCGVICLALMRVARDLGATAITSGCGGMVEDNRAMGVMIAQHAPREVTDPIRRRNLLEPTPGNGADAYHRAARAVGLAYHEVYATEPLVGVGLGISIQEFNWPREKWLAVRAFPEFFSGGFWRHHTSMQVAGGVRDLHDEVILPSRRLNPTGARAVVAVYRRWAAEGGGLLDAASEGDE